MNDEERKRAMELVNEPITAESLEKPIEAAFPFKSDKTYLGDSVYAEHTKYREIRLTTENGFGPTNTIILEPQVYEALLLWARKRPAHTCHLCGKQIHYRSEEPNIGWVHNHGGNICDGKPVQPTKERQP